MSNQKCFVFIRYLKLYEQINDVDTINFYDDKVPL